MLDKEHQKEAMTKLKQSLKQPKKVDMTPDMLKDRQTLLDSTVELMEVKDKYNLDISISEKVYELVSISQ